MVLLPIDTVGGLRCGVSIGISVSLTSYLYAALRPVSVKQSYSTAVFHMKAEYG